MRVAFVQRAPYGVPLRRAVPAGTDAGAAAPARLDVVDKGDQFAVKVDLPGIRKEDISVAVEGARVSVSGKVRGGDDAAAPEQITTRRAEGRATGYARTLELPAEVDADNAQASFENGVLTLTLPKRVHAAQIAVR